MKKLIIDGKVAVLVSPGYGAGWYTWNYDEEMIFDFEIASMLHNKVDFQQIVEYVEKQYPDAFYGALDNLIIKWLPIGTKFRIDEYDGAEWVEEYREESWYIA